MKATATTAPAKKKAPKVCACGAVARLRGMCQRCYQAARRAGTILVNEVRWCACGARAGRSGKCIPCYKADWAATPINRAKQAERRAEPEYKEEMAANGAAWYAANRQKVAARNVVRKAERAAYSVGWRANNKDWVTTYGNAYNSARLKVDLNFRLAKTLRSRVASALKGDPRAGSFVRDLNCSVDELRKHIESQFEPGMTWDNWSRKGWHIDHVASLANFDLSDRAQFLVAAHWTNLRPLWAKQNLSENCRPLST